MKILIVGGTGMIGGYLALHLQSSGHDVTVAGRKAPGADSPLAGLAFIQCDYIAADLEPQLAASFDAMVFAAGNDVRHLPPDTDPAAYWPKANSEAIPRFIKAARDAGLGRVVCVGSFYPQAAPEIAQRDAYARSRKEADEAVLALAGNGFHVCSINAPFVVGTVPGIEVPMFKAYADYAMGRLSPMPEYAPPGGVNFISVRSLSEAIGGALLNGENGKAYLVGDENLSFADFFGAFFEAAGREAPPVRNEEHPLLPDAAILWGRGNNLFYEPEPAECALLGYQRGDIRRTINDIVSQHQ
ncbi:MAG: NAD(P)-dependent oxidoreductase [Salinisphaeraceae bacterium]|nr:NAD(P)-dependent oxidoreductase [Salinisphaeraceae bacterium]